MNNRSFDTFKERFGYELEKLRRIHRIKQCDLAKHLNITQSTLSNLERGKKDITLEMFFKLFDVFGSVIIYVALLVIQFVGDINPGNKVNREVEKSFIGKEMYKYNVIELLVR